MGTPRKIKGSETNIPVEGTSIGRTLRFIQSDIAASPGNSGGPLMINNQVVGIMTWKDVQIHSEGLTFSLSSAEARDWILKLKISGLEV